MRKCILACVAVVFVCGAQGGDRGERPGRDNWIEFLNKENHFRASFPQAPKASVNENGPVPMKTFMLDLGDRAFSVIVSDVPGAQFENEKMTEDRLDGARNSMAGKYKLEKETKITIGGVLRGREILLAADQKLLVRSRIFLVNGRLYQAMVVGPREFVNGPDAGKFLDSLMLTQ